MTYKCQYFGIKELVSKIVYDKFGEQAWMFFDEEIRQDLDTIREANGAGLIINNWSSGGSLSQCGLRTNMDPLVKAKTTLYVSAHCLGKGFDLHDSLGRNQRLWTIVHNLITQKKLKKFCRLENIKSTATWVHVDGYVSDTVVFDV
jgi:hypothetical protein